MNEEVKSNTIKRLKELREKNGKISQEEFAEKIGVSAETIKKIEQGKIKLSLDNAIRIKNQYNVSLDWIYGLEEDVNDEASIMLLALRKYFNLCTKKHESTKETYLTISIEKTLRDFLLEYDDAERLIEEKGIPEAGREAWLNDIKYRFNQKNKGREKSEIINYKLTDFSDIKVLITHAPVPNPPTNF